MGNTKPGQVIVCFISRLQFGTAPKRGRPLDQPIDGILVREAVRMRFGFRLGVRKQILASGRHGVFAPVKNRLAIIE
jgi:hypothetical protein